MPWNVIIPVIIIAIMVAAYIFIKRQQDAPLRGFLAALAAARGALRDKPDMVTYAPLDGDGAAAPFRADREAAGPGTYTLEYDDVTLRFKHERTAEFLDITGGGLTALGIQFIENNPTEVYFDEVRQPEPRTFLEDFTGEVATVRRLVRKHLRIQVADKDGM